MQCIMEHYSTTAGHCIQCSISIDNVKNTLCPQNLVHNDQKHNKLYITKTNYAYLMKFNTFIYFCDLGHHNTIAIHNTQYRQIIIIILDYYVSYVGMCMYVSICCIYLIMMISK